MTRRAAEEAGRGGLVPGGGRGNGSGMCTPMETGVLAGDQPLTAEQFYQMVAAQPQYEPGMPVVVVGCEAAVAGPGAGESVAQTLARLGGGPVAGGQHGTCGPPVADGCWPRGSR